MKLSLSYYFVLFVFKLKGIKQVFSKKPIDFQRLRKDDVKTAPINLARKSVLNEYSILDSQITEIGSISDSDRLLLFFPGGAFVSGPSKHHWDTVQKIYNKTKIRIWLCDYPKAPEYGIAEITTNIDAIYREALETYHHDAISLIGDSVGGTLLISLVQRIIEERIPKPSQVFLVSPVVDSTFSNSEILDVDKKDHMLSRNGVLSAKQLCAENGDLDDVRMSPINGSFYGFPRTHLYLAEYDITYPDQRRMVEKLDKSDTDFQVTIGYKMPHIWPLLPYMKESNTALNNIIKELCCD